MPMILPGKTKTTSDEMNSVHMGHNVSLEIAKAGRSHWYLAVLYFTQKKNTNQYALLSHP